MVAGRSREPVRESEARVERGRGRTPREGLPAFQPWDPLVCKASYTEPRTLSAELVLRFFLALSAKILTQCVPELSGTSYLPVTDEKPSWQRLHK